MEIQLTYVTATGMHGEHLARDAVVHFGRNVPGGHRSVVPLYGEGIADHHGKIIFAHNAFRYVNLTGKPTQVFRGLGLLFELTPAAPSCTLVEGDRLRLGSTMVHVTRLAPPVAADPAERVPAPVDHLHFQPIRCDRCNAVRACTVDEATSGLLWRLHEYVRQHEILRAAVDWLADQYAEPRRSKGLRLGQPEVIAVVPRENATPMWEDFGVRVVRLLGANAELRWGTIPDRPIDTGRAFRMEGPGNAPAGIGAGIIEEVELHAPDPPADEQRAGHYVVVQYPASCGPTDDDLCLLHHFAATVSSLLASVEACRVRRQQELEIASANALRGDFHDRKSDCRTIRQLVSGVMGGVEEGLREDLARVLAHLRVLEEFIERGDSLQRAAREFRIARIDLPELGKEVFARVAPADESLKRRRDFRFLVASPALPELRRVPGDRRGIMAVLENLIANARRALDERSDLLLLRRVHGFADVVQRHQLRYARLRLADDGCGMNQDSLRTIFQGRFSTQGPGRGTGTLVVGEQVRRHCGFLEVASREGKGTVIGVLLPLPELPDAADETDLREALAPYRDRFHQHALVQVREWDALLAEDKRLRDWYLQQGEAHAAGPPSG